MPAIRDGPDRPHWDGLSRGIPTEARSCDVRKASPFAFREAEVNRDGLPTLHRLGLTSIHVDQ